MVSPRFNLTVPYGWYAVSLATELAVAEVKPLFFFEKDLVLFRSASGQARVLDAMCPHLGAHIGHGGKVSGESVACPFHGWEFNGDGFCTDVPYAENMPPKLTKGDSALHAYPVVEINGVIWAWYHPQQAAPLFDVDEVPELDDRGSWSKPTVHEWVINAPVQEMGENAVDKAHFEFVHSIKEMPHSEVTINGHRRSTVMDVQSAGYNEDGSFNDDDLIDRKITTLNVGPGFSLQSFIGLTDIRMLGTVTPITSEQTLLRFITIIGNDLSESGEVIAQAMLDNLYHQVEQDIPIWNHKVYRANPILCDGDGPITQYRKWFSQFYG
jgi:phenylpropionate dioxygenase-like ring-hydroxylating dioxygenase large terminal subunit